MLSVARFDADGTHDWLPLVHGQGKLTANGFPDQAEVLVKTRFAADAVGATPMDRPEDIETNPVTGRVYAVMTKNKKRDPATSSTRQHAAKNVWGHIVELIPPGGDGRRPTTRRTSTTGTCSCCAGNPGCQAGAKFHPGTSENGWFVSPDNITFDPRGRLWVGNRRGQ